MKPLSESRAIGKLSKIREDLRREIVDGFENRAKPCGACDTQGACCLDEHFVNVRVSRLEGAAIRQAVERLGIGTQVAIHERLQSIASEAEFYACPLFQPGVGCLVHTTAKPLPCIAHACYERKEDLPPDELLASREAEIDQLNRRVYGRSQPLVPIHAALRVSGRRFEPTAQNRKRYQQSEEHYVIPDRQVAPSHDLDHQPESE